MAIFLTIAPAFAAVFAIAGDDEHAKDDAKQVAQKVDLAAKGEASTPKKVGVLQNGKRTFLGYNLINPGRKQTYLYDNQGRVVHAWTSEHLSGAAAYLLDNGHLFRPSEVVNHKPGFQGPAASGRFQEFDWDGKLVWEFEYHSEKRLPHHDAIKLPNGNVLAICWERIEAEVAIAAGRRPETVKDSHLQPDCLVEIKPTGKNAGEVVWEWRSWDHLIQDHDKTKPNYGTVADHPELFDLNYIRGEEDQVSNTVATKNGRDKLGATDKTGSGPADSADAKRDPSKKEATTDDAAKAHSKDAEKKDQTPAVRKNPDWMHVNAVDYNAELDQIALSSPMFHEIWMIDHSTTTKEAKGHTGGRWGKGGDILYRWGNPRAYRNGTSLDQRLFFQHNIQWIPKGRSGQGHLLVFNNGAGRKPVEYSSVDELVPPVDKDGNYIRPKRGPFGPEKPLWSYTAPNKKDFYSWFISGAQRLPNGNTLINAGAVGTVFEVTPEGETVWKFSNPFKPVTPATRAGSRPPKRFESIASDSRDALNMTDEQRKKLDDIDNELIAKLDKILTPEQIKSLGEAKSRDTAEFRKRPPGEYLNLFDTSTLNITDARRKEMLALQNEFNPRIKNLLNDSQRNLVADFKKGQRATTVGRGTAPRQGNTLFRATRYALDHPAFADRTIVPGKTLVEIEAESDKQNAEAEAAARANRAAASH
jgi:hypothetical protein